MSSLQKRIPCVADGNLLHCCSHRVSVDDRKLVRIRAPPGDINARAGRLETYNSLTSFDIAGGLSSRVV